MTRRFSVHAAATGSVLLGALLLAGCAAAESPSSPSEPATSASPAVSASADAAPTEAPVADAALVPDGDAAANLPFFRATVESVWAGESRTSGRAYIDALTSAGFGEKTAMQVAPDSTKIGNQAESIQFSVLWKGSCLVGQVGPATGDPITAVSAVLPGDKCLVGTTRAIDW